MPYSPRASEIVGDANAWKHVHDHQLTYVRAIHMVSIRLL